MYITVSCRRFLPVPGVVGPRCWHPSTLQAQCAGPSPVPSVLLGLPPEFLSLSASASHRTQSSPTGLCTRLRQRAVLCMQRLGGAGPEEPLLPFSSILLQTYSQEQRVARRMRSITQFAFFAQRKARRADSRPVCSTDNLVPIASPPSQESHLIVKPLVPSVKEKPFPRGADMSRGEII